MANSIECFFTLVFSNILSPEQARIWLLAAVAKEGAYSNLWYEFFTTFGIVHILVFSGSQISHVIKSVDLCFSFVPMGKHLDSIWVLKIVNVACALIILAIIGEVLGWPAPAVRAGFFGLLVLVWPQMKLRWSVLLTFGLQALFFSNHLLTKSWVLSWASWLISLGLNYLGTTSFWSLVYTSSLLWLGIGIYLGMGLDLLIGALPLVLLSNILVGYLFEFYVFPLVGWLWLLGIIWVCIFPEGDKIWGVGVAILTPIVQGVTGLLLVALQSIGYIGNVL